MFFKKNSVILAKTEVSKTHKQKIDSLEQLVFDYSLFSIASNQKSLDYFENKKTGDYLSPDQIQKIGNVNFEGLGNLPNVNRKKPYSLERINPEYNIQAGVRGEVGPLNYNVR
jgi:hypothetical protein